jgi:hypothetical protein
MTTGDARTETAVASSSASGRARRPRGVPWPIWIVVLFLGLEGVGNLLAIPYQPAAAGWLAFKALAIVGLIRGWRWVFVLFLVVAGYHALAFGTVAPFVASLNLALVLLAGSSLRHFFPPADPGRTPARAGASDQDFGI